MQREQEAAVWQRVMAASAKAPEACQKPREESVTPQKLLQANFAQQALLTTLPAGFRSTVQHLKNQLQSDQKTLQAIVYIISGEAPQNQQVVPLNQLTVPETLRQAHQNALAMAKNAGILAQKNRAYAPEYTAIQKNQQTQAQTFLLLLQQSL